MTRRELIEVVGERYRGAIGKSKRQILDEFVRVSGYHRKHALRLFRPKAETVRKQLQSEKRLYGEAVREALIVVWEAADRICGKRLKPMIPILVDAMERHGHWQPAPEVRKLLLRMSAATIDRLLRQVREQASGIRRRRGVATALRRSIPVRTFADWKDPAPGYLEADFVAHCGGYMVGSFVHSFVLTDIATGWTECIAMVVRDQNLVVDALEMLRERLPFPLLGFDTDNDGAFINEVVLGHCRQNGIEFTRSRAYQKNDQAWIEQKNGAVVRKLIGYGRLEGMAATAVLAELYEASRLYVNFFQPSFKLKSKTRTGARVVKRYYAPVTPYERLLSSTHIPESQKQKLRVQFASLDPIQLLERIRQAQSRLANLEQAQARAETKTKQTICPIQRASSIQEQRRFVISLRTAWRQGEVRPTHRKKVRAPRYWRTRLDPFEAVWAMLKNRLEESPGRTAKELFQQLQREQPGRYPDCQLRTLQRRVKDWRKEIVKKLLFGAGENHQRRDETVLATVS